MPEEHNQPAELTETSSRFGQALHRLRKAHEQEPFAPIFEVLDCMEALIEQPGGFAALYEWVPEIEVAQVFAGSDWNYPSTLVPGLAWRALRQGDYDTTRIEILSEVRLLAIALGDYEHPDMHPENAQHLLRQVMALNLDLTGGTLSEADRNRPGRLGHHVMALYRFLLDRMGSEHLVDDLAAEVWRTLAQRPVRVDTVKQMVMRISIGLAEPEVAGSAQGAASQLVRALFTPSPGTQEDPGLTAYAEWLAEADYDTLRDESAALGMSMRETGLASPYHPVLLRHLRGRHDALLLTALGLSSTGCDSLLCYPQLVHALIDAAVVYPETSQAVHGLAMMLERGMLHVPGLAAALWRQLAIQPGAITRQRISEAFGDAHPAQVFLLADLITMLGQPLGVGQGNHPTCQSARALSMWASTKPLRLMELLTEAVRDDDVIMRFEGEELSSAALPPGSSPLVAPDVDAVSLAMVPHLDRIYWEMGRRCAQRGGDPHRWVNLEFHGEGVFRDFCLAVDVATGQLVDLEGFIRLFHWVYHPFYNGGVPLIHPQPAGIASTDSHGRFLGWHAISIQRLALDASGHMRVYFYNPNNDSAQDWGQGIVTSIAGQGELPGESSLPMAQFMARLYAFHYDRRALVDTSAMPQAEIDEIAALVRDSWGRGR